MPSEEQTVLETSERASRDENKQMLWPIPRSLNSNGASRNVISVVLRTYTIWTQGLVSCMFWRVLRVRVRCFLAQLGQSWSRDLWTAVWHASEAQNLRWEQWSSHKPWLDMPDCPSSIFSWMNLDGPLSLLAFSSYEAKYLTITNSGFKSHPSISSELIEGEPKRLDFALRNWYSIAKFWHILENHLVRAK